MQALTHAPLLDEVPLALLAKVQEHLGSILGTRFTAVLAGSGNHEDATHYHLAILHNRSGLSVEAQGTVGPSFIEEIFALAWRMKGMLESRDLQRMDAQGPVRLLTWISELNCPVDLKAIASELYPEIRRLTLRS